MCIPTPFAFPNTFFACIYLSSNQEVFKTFGFSEGHIRWFWEDFILMDDPSYIVKRRVITNKRNSCVHFLLITRNDFLETQSQLRKHLLMHWLLYLFCLSWYRSSLSLAWVFLVCWVNMFHSDSLAVGDAFASVSGMTALWWEILLFVNWFTEYICWHLSI